MQRNTILRVLCAALAAFVLILSGCDEAIVYVDGVAITEPETTTYTVGDTVEITVAIEPADATLPEVEWTTDPADIVAVEASADGATVTALAPGTVTITATSLDGTRADTLELTIIAAEVPVTGVTIATPTTATYTVGQTVDLTAAVTPDDATNLGVTWSTSSDGVVSLSETDTGVTVTALAAGSVDVVATSDADDTISDSLTLTVSPTAVTRVTIDTPTTTTLTAGQTVDLTATVAPDDATNLGVTWSTSSDGFVSLSETATGVTVTALAAGTVDIIATSDADDTHADTLELTIVAAEVPVTGVTIDTPTTTTCTVGQTVDLTATVAPDDATNPGVTWSTSADDVVSLSETGTGVTVTALAVGSVDVVAASDADGTISDSLTLTVEPTAVTGVTIADPTTTTLTAGQSVDLTATVAPDDATNPGVTWSTSTDGLVSLSETDTGVTVTALAVGSVDVVATSDADDTISDSLTLTVEPIAVTGVTINTPTTTTIGVAGTVTLEATIDPDDATDQSVTWSSDDTDVATVDPSTGEVTGVAAGTATITATTTDGSYTDTVEITVATIEITTAGPLSFGAGTGRAQRVEIALSPADLEYTVTVADDTIAHFVDELPLPDVFRLVGLTAGSTTVTIASTENSAVSDTIEINVGADTTDPRLAEWGYLVDENTIHLEYTELMNTTSAETIANYTIKVNDNPVTVTGVSVVSPENPWAGTHVRVDLDATLANGDSVGVEVTNVSDVAGNSLPGTDTWGWKIDSGFGSIDSSKITVAPDGTVSLAAGAVTMETGYSGFMVFAVIPEAPDKNSFALALGMVNADGSTGSLTRMPVDYGANALFRDDFVQAADDASPAVFRTRARYGIGYMANDPDGTRVFGPNEGTYFDVTTGWEP